MTILWIGLLPAAMGFLLIRGMSPVAARLRHNWFSLVLGTGIGIGLCSQCYFIGLVTGYSGTLPEILLLSACGMAAFLNRKHTSFRSRKTGSSEPIHASLTRYLTCVLILLLLLQFAVFAWLTVRNPRGGWDAWAIWNLRARFLYRAEGAAWRDAFTEVIAWSHPDYPLLLPGFVARGWKLLGRESTAVPAALAFFFTFGCAGLITASVTVLRGVPQGILAGLALASTPSLYVQGAMQVADIPTAFYILATLTCLAMADRFSDRGFAALAGVAAALGAWTKNEGLMWLVALLIAGCMTTRRRSLAAFLAGAVPALAPVLFFKIRIATPSDIFGNASRAGMMARVLNPARYVLIAREAFRQVRDFGPLFVSGFVLLALYVAVAGLRGHNRDWRILRTGTLALAFMALGYCAIYLVHPLDLQWELNNSSGRLLLQIWPGIVFMVFLATRTPLSQPQLGADPSTEAPSSSPGSLISR